MIAQFDKPTEQDRAVRLMRKFGLEPDDWQLDVLQNRHPRLLLNCCRQAGKSTVVALLAFADALFVPDTKVLLLSRSHRQSAEMLRTIVGFFERLGEPMKKRASRNELALTNHSRIICLPCREDTIRGYADVDLLVIDEAARVPDDLYRAVRPMLAVSEGRMICLSTPYGKRGFFYLAWAHGGADWTRIEIPAAKVPRIQPAFLEEERRGLGESWYRQEYCCAFEALEGLVYPDFAMCIVDDLPSNLQFAIANSQFSMNDRDTGSPLQIENCQSPIENCRWIGGIDFGFRNPFAAVWGVVDRDGVLWIVGKHYQRQRPLSHHVHKVPRQVTWYADPSGAGEIADLRSAGLIVRAADNALRNGIATVTARIENGTLKALKSRCPNLLDEAQLYRYDDAEDADGRETPLSQHNHALDALRYLIVSLDKKSLGRSAPKAPREMTDEEWRKERDGRYWEIMNDDDPNSPHWIRLS